MDVVKQPFTSVRCLSRDEPPVLLDDHSRPSREVLVHERYVAAVALANKLARMAWAVLAKNEPYRPPVLADAATD